MKHFKAEDVRNYLNKKLMSEKPLPTYVKNQMPLIKEYLASDRYYSYSDDRRVWSVGYDRHKSFNHKVEMAICLATSSEEKDFLQRLVKGYGHHDEKSILPELSHPKVTNGGKTPQVKFFEKYGVESMEDAEALDKRLVTAHENVANFINSLDLNLVPGMSWIKYLIYRDRLVAVDEALKEALLYHRPLAINNVLHDQIGRFIDRNCYELSLMSDLPTDLGPESMVKPDSKVWFGKVRGYDELLTIELVAGKKGFIALMRKR